MPAISPARNSNVPSVRMFASCAPGLGPLLAAQLSALGGVHIAWTGNDGRADLVSFSAQPSTIPALSKSVTIAEDLFIQIGHARRSDGDRPGWLAQRLCRNEQLSTATATAGRVSVQGTYRVVVRVLSERSFPRTELRRHFEAVVGRLRPSWRHSDPAANELWVCEYRQGLFVAGLRMTSPSYRQRGGRRVERAGALRPGIAAALVWLAGKPNGVLVDPCCGSGSVLAEAAGAGWEAAGFDVDPEAVAVARENLAGTAIVQSADARRLKLRDGSAGAWVSNVPFGIRHSLPADSPSWFRAVLMESARVVRREGMIVVLSAGVPASAVPKVLQRRGRSIRVRVLGRAAVIDVFLRS